MQFIYFNLTNVKLIGELYETRVRITMTENYNFKDTEFEDTYYNPVLKNLNSVLCMKPEKI